jgi:hypothetical protein
MGQRMPLSRQRKIVARTVLLVLEYGENRVLALGSHFELLPFQLFRVCIEPL